MSRLGKKPISLSPAVAVEERDEHTFIVRGPLGEHTFSLHPDFVLQKEEGGIKIVPKATHRRVAALWGTSVALLKNAIQGVQEGFAKTLVIEGLGYGAEVQMKAGERRLVLRLGYTNPVILPIPDEVSVEVRSERGTHHVTIKGIDKEKVGHFTALVRKQRPVEPYKGKGIRYLNEKVRRKQGKKLGK